ncbi:RagB/SusD family nutrient uptake outer membrane protein [Bacteroides sp.]|uniref:RagB/SusD family nutrient uptake outer membrane protein n=1 Tax=Bacteroides sp. TaxID=29523 RepID=UPI003AB5231B
MKKQIFSFITAAVLLGGLSSCGEGFLEIDHYDILEPEVLLQSEKNIISGLNGLYDMFYPERGSGTTDVQSQWNIKPQLAFSNYPALDCQASGWDNEFTRHEWRADKDMFYEGWKQSYKAVDRANRFLAKLEGVDPSIFAEGEKTKNIIIAQTRAIRAFFYSFLAQNFGRLPMLMTGDTYTSSPEKPRAESTDITWNLIIEDFKYASEILGWKPWNDEKGRITRGMTKAYLAQAYMYNKKYAEAKKELGDIIQSGEYRLNPCYGYIHLEDRVWDAESVWELPYPHFSDLNWGADGKNDATWWVAQLTASPEYGGWGSLYISYEYCESFEAGDKRLKYSAVRKGETNPFTGETVGASAGFEDDFVTSESMPNNFGLKYWKRHPGSDGIIFNPQSAIWMRYAAVLLNYAECCFETGDAATGWEMIHTIRNRAWGNLEVNLAQGDFPIPLRTEVVEVPDAETFYAKYRTDKGYTSDVWKVALTIERRHEFLAEFSFWYDLCRTNMAKEFLDCEYPKNQGWTKRTFDFDPNRMIYPIPTDEIRKNNAISQSDQNPGY